MTVAEGTGAGTIQARKELMINFSHAASRVDVSGVNETVHVTRLLIELQELLVRQVFLVRALWA